MIKKSQLEEDIEDIETRLRIHKESINESEDEKLMRTLGITREQLKERKQMENGLSGHILMSEIERRQAKKKSEQESLVFDQKTMEFIEYLF